MRRLGFARRARSDQSGDRGAGECVSQARRSSTLLQVDGVLVQAVGQVAGLVAWLVAGRSRYNHLQQMLAVALGEFVALYRLVEGKVPGGGAVPQIDL